MFMVIRFEKRGRKGILPLFDRLSHRNPLPSRRLSDREIAHRRRMLNHLSPGLAARPVEAPGR
jgi:hypothetical protein